MNIEMIKRKDARFDTEFIPAVVERRIGITRCAADRSIVGTVTDYLQGGKTCIRL